MIRFICECGKELQACEEDAGKLALCPVCQRQVIVPAESPSSDAVQQERPIRRDEPEMEEEGEIEERLRRQPDGNSRKVVANLALDILLILPPLLIPAVERVGDAVVRTQSSNHLKQMVLAMHHYNDRHGHLPAAAITDSKGAPLLSWRVAILPFIGQQNLYRQFKLDEPWDGPHNIKLLAQMPAIYKWPGGDKTPADHTHYQMFVGNGAAFEKIKPMRLPEDFWGGTSNTILIIEARQAVPWTKPEDVDFDPNKPMLRFIITYSRGGFQVALGDGSVRMVDSRISERIFNEAITREDDTLGDW